MVFRGEVNDWFKDYLNDRKRYVSYNENKSVLKNISCGVPQGSRSILGPLLFIMYNNDIIQTSAVLDFSIFADDTTIFYSSNDFVNDLPAINHELLEVSNWFKANKVSVNAGKTNYLITGTPKMTSMGISDDLSLQSNFDII